MPAFLIFCRFFKKAFNLVELLTNICYYCLEIGDSPSGKATDSDSVIRGFKSLIPSHKKRTPTRCSFFMVLLDCEGFERVGIGNLEEIITYVSCRQTVVTHCLPPRRDSKALPCGANPTPKILYNGNYKARF